MPVVVTTRSVSLPDDHRTWDEDMVSEEPWNGHCLFSWKAQ